MRLLAVIAEPFRPDLRRRFASETVEPAGDLFLPTTVQVQRIDMPHRDRRFCVNLDLSGIFVFPVSKGRRDHEPLFLLLPVARTNLLSDIFGIIIIH